jgi:hypothetical protein
VKTPAAPSYFISEPNPLSGRLGANQPGIDITRMAFHDLAQGAVRLFSTPVADPTLERRPLLP